MDETPETSLPTVCVILEAGAVQNIIGNAKVNVLVCDMDVEAGDSRGYVLWEVEEAILDDIELLHDLIAEWEAMEAA